MNNNNNRDKRLQNRGFNKNFKKSNNVRRKNIDDYSFYVGTSKQASDFKISSEFIINYIKRTFERGNDIAKSLRTLTIQPTITWKPKLQDSTSTEKRKRGKEKMKTNKTNWNSKQIYKNT